MYFSSDIEFLYLYIIKSDLFFVFSAFESMCFLNGSLGSLCLKKNCVKSLLIDKHSTNLSDFTKVTDREHSRAASIFLLLEVTWEKWRTWPLVECSRARAPPQPFEVGWLIRDQMHALGSSKPRLLSAFDLGTEGSSRGADRGSGRARGTDWARALTWSPLTAAELRCGSWCSGEVERFAQFLSAQDEGSNIKVQSINMFLQLFRVSFSNECGFNFTLLLENFLFFFLQGVCDVKQHVNYSTKLAQIKCKRHFSSFCRTRTHAHTHTRGEVTLKLNFWANFVCLVERKHAESCFLYF